MIAKNIFIICLFLNVGAQVDIHCQEGWDCTSSCWKDGKCNPFLSNEGHGFDGGDCFNADVKYKCDGGPEEVEYCRQKCDCNKNRLSKECELCCTQILTGSNTTIDPFATTTLKPGIPLSECGKYIELPQNTVLP